MGILEGKVAVITGSSRGLGLAMAEVYAREGASVVLAARTKKDVAEAVKELQAKGYNAAGASCDVGEYEQVKALADYAVTAFRKFDIWVNNAGVAGVYGPTAHIPRERFERVIRTNINGTYYGSIVALEHFLPQKSGKLINLLGRGDDGPVKFQNAYAPSKYWVKSFTAGLAEEYKDSGVDILAFNPGLVDTDMLRQVDSLAGYEHKLKALSTIIRLWGNPPEVPAERALWLASSATDGKSGLVEKVLGRKRIFGGLLREAGRRVRRAAKPDTRLTIITIEPTMPLPQAK
ncbi:MAG: SDR family NAD(P)-dependent oxidoreductase [Anaerolineaceae bacterium]|nr:SDR family NAD(P)-dependent oxidoreductase [Anaerolineaceae bacterium]